MTTRDDQSRAAALLWLLDGTEAGQRFLVKLEPGRRYRAAQKLYGSYERKAIDWCFAANLDRGSKSWCAVQRWWPDRGPAPTGTLVLLGGKGCGKTTAAVGLLLRQGGEFVRAGLLHEIPLGEKGDEQMDRLRNARLLVLDNLGSEKDIGPTLARIHGVIVHRDGLGLPTVITTTLVPDYRDRYGEPIDGVRPERTIVGRYEDDVADRINGDGEWENVSEPSRRSAKHRPDLRRVLESARLADLYDEVVLVKRGAGDPRAVDVLAAEARVSDEQILRKAAEAESGMAAALADLPDYLRDHPVFARYAEKWGVAPAGS